MSWARSAAYGAIPLAILVAAFPALGRTEAEPRPPFDLDRMTEHGAVYVAPSANGGSTELTLDRSLEQAALKILATANPVRGGLVAIDVRTGKVLVWAESARDGRHHHVLSTARVPAASVFKVVTTAALFENTKLTPHDEVCISGGFHDIERRHLDSPHGDATDCSPFASALGHSKNAVFAQLATHRLLRTDLIGTAEALGFNGNVPFDLEVPVGKLTVPYNDLEFARTAAGFQGSTLSPLGGAHLANVIAHGGEATRIRISDAAPEAPAGDKPVDATHDAEARAASVSAPRVLKALTAERIRRMMEVTVRSGTSRHAFNDEKGHPFLGNIRVAGKTGTLRPEANEGMTSWFIGFAPAQKPEIVISVMLENGSVWRHKSNELARDFLRVYFHGHGRPWVTDALPPTSSERVASQ